MTYVRNHWSRCGNTLFYIKLKHHDTIGYTHIDPADLVQVKWEELPEGFTLVRKEVPEDADWASAEMIRFKISQLPNELQRRFWTWLNFMDIFKKKGLSPHQIVNSFHEGYPPLVREETLDALDQGVFTADLVWLEKRIVVGSRQELDEALSDLGVMECPT